MCGVMIDWGMNTRTLWRKRRGRVERMSESCRCKSCGNAERQRPRRTYIDLFGDVFQKSQVRSTHNRRACMIKCMNVDEAKGVYR